MLLGRGRIMLGWGSVSQRWIPIGGEEGPCVQYMRGAAQDLEAAHDTLAAHYESWTAHDVGAAVLCGGSAQYGRQHAMRGAVHVAGGQCHPYFRRHDLTR